MSPENDSTPEVPGTQGTILVIRIFAVLIMLAGIALIIVPLITGRSNTITLFAYLFAGVGLIGMGYGLLQLHLWGFYMSLAGDIILVVALLFNYHTLPFFKSFAIIICVLVFGYLVLNRDFFQTTDTI